MLSTRGEACLHFRSEREQRTWSRPTWPGLFYICQRWVNNQHRHSRISTHQVFNYAPHQVSRNLNWDVIRRKTERSTSLYLPILFALASFFFCPVLPAYGTKQGCAVEFPTSRCFPHHGIAASRCRDVFDSNPVMFYKIYWGPSWFSTTYPSPTW